MYKYGSKVFLGMIDNTVFLVNLKVFIPASAMSPKVILVTGANRGIGFGIVQSLAQMSSENVIIVASRQKDAAEKAIEELKKLSLDSSFHPLALDVTSDNSIQAAVEEIGKKFGRLDG